VTAIVEALASAPWKLELHRGITTLFNPTGLMNPGEKQ
jgi:hypothetical protein